MIQLMTFLIAQLMFVPVYLKVTDTCTENKGTFWQKIKIISISPFAVYLYVNIFFAFAMVVLCQEKVQIKYNQFSLFM